MFIDPNAKSPDEKYKMFIKVSSVRGKPKRNDRGPIPVRVTKHLPKAQYAFTSSDGIRWRLLSTQKANPGPKNDTAFSVFWDDRIDQYVQYTRVWMPAPEQVAYYRRTHKGYRPTFFKSAGRSPTTSFIGHQRKWHLNRTTSTGPNRRKA